MGGADAPAMCYSVPRSCLLWPKLGVLLWVCFLLWAQRESCVYVCIPGRDGPFAFCGSSGGACGNNGEPEAHCLHSVYRWLRLRFFLWCVCPCIIYMICVRLCFGLFFIGAGGGGVCVLFMFYLLQLGCYLSVNGRCPGAVAS